MANNTMTEEELRNKTINAGLEDNLQDDYVETPVVATPTYAEPPKQTHWYEQVFKEENGDLNLNEEDRKKLRRRERAERTIAGLGDLGAHIANVWGAAKGSTPATINKTMSDAYNTKWEKLGLDYDQRKRAYNSGLAAARKLDYQQYMSDRKQYLAEKKEDRVRAEKEYTNALTEARTYKLYADMARTQGESDAKINYYNKMADAAEKRADYWAAMTGYKKYHPSGSGGSRSGGKTYKGTPYSNQTEYNAMVIQDAQRLGIPTEKKEFGKTVKRSIADILADIRNAESKGGNRSGNSGQSGSGKGKGY